MKALRWILRLVLSGLFIYAGWMKMRDPQAFVESVASFRLLPEVLISPVALTLPPLETIAAILALIGSLVRRAGAFCLLVLLGIFLVALGSAVARGINVDCGCFAADHLDILSPTKNLWTAIGRDFVLIVVAWFLYADARRSTINSPLIHRPFMPQNQ